MRKRQKQPKEKQKLQKDMLTSLTATMDTNLMCTMAYLLDTAA